MLEWQIGKIRNDARDWQTVNVAGRRRQRRACSSRWSISEPCFADTRASTSCISYMGLSVWDHYIPCHEFTSIPRLDCYVKSRVGNGSRGVTYDLLTHLYCDPWPIDPPVLWPMTHWPTRTVTYDLLTHLYCDPWPNICGPWPLTQIVIIAYKHSNNQIQGHAYVLRHITANDRVDYV